MTFFSDTLGPYKDYIGMVASFLTILQFFSGFFTCHQLRKEKSTVGISVIPFIGGIVIGLIMFKYGLLLGDLTTIIVNLVATILNVVYCGFYLFYCDKKFSEVYKWLIVGILGVAGMWLYGDLEDPEKVEFRYGLIAAILMLAFMAAPLFGAREMVAKKDASEIPLGMTVLTTIVTILWLLYALAIINNFMLLQNVFGLILCAAQLFLLFKYPGTKTD